MSLEVLITLLFLVLSTLLFLRARTERNYINLKLSSSPPLEVLLYSPQPTLLIRKFNIVLVLILLSFILYYIPKPPFLSQTTIEVAMITIIFIVVLLTAIKSLTSFSDAPSSPSAKKGASKPKQTKSIFFLKDYPNTPI